MKATISAIAIFASILVLTNCGTTDGETPVGGVTGATSGRTHQGAVIGGAGGRAGNKDQHDRY